MIPDGYDEDSNMKGGRFYSVIESLPQVFFGGYPSLSNMVFLANENVVHMIDLTTPHEKERLPIYDAKEHGMMYANFPIPDNFIPSDLERFNEFMVWLCYQVDRLKPEERIYVHCKGGHGRSGMVMACLLCMMANKSPEESIHETTSAHRERPLLSPKWKTRMCPSNHIQRLFVHNHIGNSLVREAGDALNNARRRLLHGHGIPV